MATQKFKAPLNSARFPFLYSRASRAALTSGLDIAPRTSQAFFGAEENADYNLIQPLYMENVLPSATGLFSVAIQEEVAAHSPATTDFDRLITLRDSEENNVLFSPAGGANYVYNDALGSWESKNPFVPGATSNLVTKGYVGGRTFICYEYERVIEWDPSLLVFNTLVLTLPAGYAITDIRGITGASNYLIAFTATEILWSSLIDLLDFDDAVGGAGKQTPIDLKGPINAVEPIPGGFVVYTSRNAVAAYFTGNAALPFSFKEIAGSGGVATADQVTSDANVTGHYTYGSSGLQLTSLQRAESVFPDASDFLVTREYEYWDSTAKEVVNEGLSTLQQAKLVYLANRYLFISYGWQTNQYTFALVYDSALKRWGKVRVNHIDVGILPLEAGGGAMRYYELDTYDVYTLVAYEDLVESYGAVPPLREGFIFLEPTGAIQYLSAAATSESASGVLLLGHVQVTRGRKVTFQKAELDGLFNLPVPILRILGASNGYDRDTVYTPSLAVATSRYSEYRGRVTAENFDIAVEGRFDLTTLLVETTVHGNR